MLKNKLYNQINRVKSYIDDLKTIQYYNDASNHAIDSYKVFFTYLIDHFEEIDESNYQTLYLKIYSFIIPNLRYIERSTTSNIPWSLIPNLDKILKSEFGDNYYLLYRPQWKFNYSVFTNDLLTSLKSFLKPIFPLKDKEIYDAFGFNKIHIFSFPYLEKNNVLLNSIIGHEIGHFFHNNWVKSDLAGQILEEHKIKLSSHYRHKFPSDIVEPYEKMVEGLEILKGMYREILSDIYGYIIFGPSMLFSLYEISHLDTSPTIPSQDNNYYPIIKYRIRFLYESFFKKDDNVVSLRNGKSQFSNIFHKYLTEIEEYLNKTDDLDKLRIIEKEVELFENSLPRIVQYFMDNVKYEKFIPKYSEELYQKLDNNIPINEYKNEPIEIGSIIFIGWIYLYYIYINYSTTEYAAKYKVLMRLLMKSLSSTYIHQEYLNSFDR